jgi:hypothetical protein
MRRSLYAVALLGMLACGRGDQAADTSATMATDTAATPVDARAQTAAMLANAIEAKPAAADSILGAAGYTRDTYEALMYEIAADSASSAAYAAARATVTP